MNKWARRFALTTVIAGIFGYIAGILTAPKSGRETREDIKDTVNKSVKEIEKRLKEIHTELDVLLKEATKRAENIKGKAKKEIDDVIVAAAKAKDKTRVALSSIRDGEAEDKDLQKAITDAEKAIDHLKKYLAK